MELKLTNFYEVLLNRGLKLIWLEDLHRADQQVVAEKISAITAAEETLLYQSLEEILDKLTVVVVLDRDDNIISMCSVMSPGINQFGHTVSEMGGMWTRSDYRHLQLATHLAQLVEAKAEEKGVDILYAFCCSYSVKILSRLGYVGEVSVDELGWSEYPIAPDLEGNVNAADLIDSAAINFCRNVCCNESAIEAMDRLEMVDIYDSPIVRESIGKAIDKDRRQRIGKHQPLKWSLIVEAENASVKKDYAKLNVIQDAISIIDCNLNGNDLRCCDLVVMKVI